MSSLPPKNYEELAYVQTYRDFQKDPEKALKPNEIDAEANAKKGPPKATTKGYSIQGQVIDTSKQRVIDVNKLHKTDTSHFQEPTTGWAGNKLEDKKNVHRGTSGGTPQGEKAYKQTFQDGLGSVGKDKVIR